MAKTAPKEVLVKKKIKDGLTKERILKIMIYRSVLYLKICRKRLLTTKRHLRR